MLGNIKDILAPVMDSQSLRSLSGLVGSSPDETKRGLATAVPASLGGLADYAKSPGGSQDLVDRIKSGNYPSLDANSVGKLQDEAGQQNFMSSSGNFAQHIFGDKLNSVVGGLAAKSGTSGGVAGKLMGVALPLVMGFVGKHVTKNGLNASQLTNFLDQQKRGTGAGVSEGLSDAGEHASERISQGAPRHIEHLRHEPRKKSIVPVVLAGLALLLGLGWIFTRRSDDTSVTQRTPVAAPRGDETGMRETAGYGPTDSQTLNEMQRYLGSGAEAPKTFKLSSAGDANANQLGNLLRQHPDAKVRLGGGKAAENLGRALGKLGVTSDRITTASSSTVGDGVEVLLMPK